MRLACAHPPSLPCPRCPLCPQSMEEVAFPLLEALVCDEEVVIRQHVAEQVGRRMCVCARAVDEGRGGCQE